MTEHQLLANPSIFSPPLSYKLPTLRDSVSPLLKGVLVLMLEFGKGVVDVGMRILISTDLQARKSLMILIYSKKRLLCLFVTYRCQQNSRDQRENLLKPNKFSFCLPPAGLH